MLTDIGTYHRSSSVGPAMYGSSGVTIPKRSLKGPYGDKCCNALRIAAAGNSTG